MVTLQCEVPNCTISKTADDLPTALQLLQLHDKQAHGAAAAVSVADKQKAPKIDRPTINQGCTEEDWAAFSRRWDLFKSGTALHPSQVTPQLIACCETEFESALFRDDPQVASKSADIVLASIKRLAVIGVALSAPRAATLKTCQEPGEPIRNYVARLRGKAHVCNFTTKGSCGNDACIADFTDDMVKMIMINGLADEDVKKDILSTIDIDDKTLADTVSLIDSKEITARAMMATPTVAISSYKKSKKPPQGDQTIKIKCTDCARAMPKVTMVRGRPREFKKCKDCWDKNRAAKTPEQALFQVVGVIHSRPQMSLFVQKRGKVAVRRPDRYTFKGPGLGWRVADALPHPTLSLQVSTDLVAYDEFDIPPPPASSARQEVVADSGAQVCIMGINRLHQMGLRKRDLIPVQRGVQAANEEDLTILGALFLTYTGYDKGVPVKTSALTYVTSSVQKFYLSYECMRILGIVDADFPRVRTQASLTVAVVGEVAPAATISTSPRPAPLSSHCHPPPVPLVTLPDQAQTDLPSPPDSPDQSQVDVPSRPYPPGQPEPWRPPHAPQSALAPCGCLLCTTPPPRPAQLPFSPTPENTPKMRNWLVNRFASSSFNKCPHQPLPAMPGPPMEITVDPKARAYVTGDQLILHFIGKKRSRVSWSGMRRLGLLSMFLQTLLWHGCTPQFTPLKQMGPLGGLWICSLSTSIASGIPTIASHLLSKQDLFPLTQWEQCWTLGMGSTPLKSERRTAILPPSSLKKVGSDTSVPLWDSLPHKTHTHTGMITSSLMWNEKLSVSMTPCCGTTETTWVSTGGGSLITWS